MALTNERLYENAVDQEYCGWVCPYGFTARRFEHLGAYRDATEHAANCHRLAQGDHSDPALRNLYLSAVELQLDGYPQLAAVKFRKLSESDFLNSRRHLSECEAALAQTPPAVSGGTGVQMPDPVEADETAHYLDAYNSRRRSASGPFPGWPRAALCALAAACFALGAVLGTALSALL